MFGFCGLVKVAKVAPSFAALLDREQCGKRLFGTQPHAFLQEFKDITPLHSRLAAPDFCFSSTDLPKRVEPLIVEQHSRSPSLTDCRLAKGNSPAWMTTAIRAALGALPYRLLSQARPARVNHFSVANDATADSMRRS